MHARPTHWLRSALAASLLYLSSAPFAAPDLSSTTAAVTPGASFVATLALDSFTGLESLDVDFEFDPAVLSLVDAAMAPGAPEPFIAPFVELGVGQTRLAVVYLDASSGASGPFLQATFQSIGPAPGSAGIRALVSINEGPPMASNTLTVAVVPEPEAGWLVLAGLGGVIIAAKRRTVARA